MAHSHDRTLLARFGFQDPDLKEPIHDLACEYMALAENALAITKMVSSIEVNHDRTIHRINGHFIQGKLKSTVEEVQFKCNSNVECALTKGINQYRVTIGFIDVKIFWETQQRIVGTFVHEPQEIRDKETGKWIMSHSDPIQVDEWERGPEGTVVVEVKIHQIGVGELLRQMNLYREHLSGTGRASFVVAVAYDVDEYYRDALAREHIALVKLGDKFHKWGATRFGTSKAKIPEF